MEIAHKHRAFEFAEFAEVAEVLCLVDNNMANDDSQPCRSASRDWANERVMMDQEVEEEEGALRRWNFGGGC